MLFTGDEIVVGVERGILEFIKFDRFTVRTFPFSSDSAYDSVKKLY